MRRTGTVKTAGPTYSERTPSARSGRAHSTSVCYVEVLVRDLPSGKLSRPRPGQSCSTALLTRRRRRSTTLESGFHEPCQAPRVDDERVVAFTGLNADEILNLVLSGHRRCRLRWEQHPARQPGESA